MFKTKKNNYFSLPQYILLLSENVGKYEFLKDKVNLPEKRLAKNKIRE